MPSIDDGYAKEGQSTLNTRATGSGSNSNNGGNGAYYPTGTYEAMSGPNAYTMAGGPISVIAGQLFSAGKALWNQTQYGMNSEVKDNYLSLYIKNNLKPLIINLI